MAESIEVIIRAVDEASAAINQVNESLGKTGEVSAVSSTSMTELNSTIEVGQKVMETLGRVYDATIQKTINYAAQVEELSQISGQSAESTSRLISFTEQYGVKTEALTMANKKLSGEGLTLSIDTMKKLSQEYNQINNDADRAKFLTDNFGRSGYQLADIMEMGADAIQKNSDAINANLILTQKQIDQTKQLTVLQEQNKQVLEGLSVSIGLKLVPPLSDLERSINNNIDKTEWWQKALMAVPIANVVMEIGSLVNAHMENTAAMDAMTDSAKRSGQSQGELAAAAAQAAADETTNAATIKTALAGEAEMIKNVSDASKSRLSILGNLQSANDNYKNSIDSLNTEYEKEKEAMWKDIAKYGEYDSRIDAHKAKLDELKIKMGETADAQDKATHRIELDYLTQILSVDGLDKRELDYVMKQGEKWGIYSQDTVTEMNKVINEAEGLKRTIDQIPTQKSISIDVSMYMPDGSAILGHKAAGGPVDAGMPYVVGEHGQELFIPSQDGTIMPAGSFGKQENGGTRGGNVILVYSPGISLGSEQEIMNWINKGIRAAQADGRLPGSA